MASEKERLSVSPTARTMKHQVVALGGFHLVLVLHKNRAPSEPEWDSYIADYEAAGKRLGWSTAFLGSMALTDGGGPTATQRGDIAGRLTRPHPHLRGAVVTDNAMVRGIVTALNWVSPTVTVKAFDPLRLADAVAHLRLPASTVEPLWLEIEQLDQEIRLSTVAVIRKLWRPDAKRAV